MKPRINPFEKRQKEFKRKERQKQKAERREAREREKAEKPTTDAGEDPDIAGTSRAPASAGRRLTGHQPGMKPPATHGLTVRFKSTPLALLMCGGAEDSESAEDADEAAEGAEASDES